MESWKEIDGFPNYWVSNFGRVKSTAHMGRLVYLKPTTSQFGYQRVGLYKGKKKSLHSMHQLVARAFIPNPNNLLEVNHKDEVKTNNHVDNLEWCTRQYNTEYSQAKEYSFVSPDGIVVHVFNLNKFCRDNLLDKGAMSGVISGKRKHHKRWTLHIN